MTSAVLPVPTSAGPVPLREAATLSATEVCAALDTDPVRGLPADEVDRRRQRWGSNTLVSHRARPGLVLWRQVRSPLLALLVTTATASFFLGQRSDAAIIGVIVAVSVGLGFVNEYRAERAAAALHDQIRHQVVAVRAGRPQVVDVADLVPGDVVDLHLGEVVPADLRLLDTAGLECDESVLTGESLPVDKSADAGTADDDGRTVARMGSTVHAGSGRGVVVETGLRTGFGRIAQGLQTDPLQTEFQHGLRRFSMLLVWVAGALTTSIFVVNVVLQRPVLDALLFSLAIAVGITPQLLPAVVSTSLAAGSRALRRRRVLVKRLVCIEDLGNVDVLFTDKTGTLTDGRIAFMRAVPAGDDTDVETVVGDALLCTTDRGAGNPLDTALWNSPAAATRDHDRDHDAVLASVPFDHDRRMASVLVSDRDGRVRLVTKGAPESVLARCVDVPGAAEQALAAEFAAGNRVVAVATRPMTTTVRPTPTDEQGLHLTGFLVFLDPPKADAAASLRRLATLGITVKVVTGDNPAVAAKVCTDLGLGPVSTLTGDDLDRLDDDALAAAIETTTVFARVTPQDKARIVAARQRRGGDVAFLGDGVNDALALHAADVGISVDSGTDVAKDAADVILLDKDLDVLADGVTEGRRIFANTIKYVLMGTSSNFGNMFSAAGASLFLQFLPMLPGQILLNNLLYDTSQLAIPTDAVDDAQLRRPAHWDLAFIRRFMLVFGPLSSAFDFLTFAVMLLGFHAGAAEFRTGWFVESLATQTLIVFAIRTRRVPFYRSRPSLPLTLAALGVVATGLVLPVLPVGGPLGFTPLPSGYFAALIALAAGYLVLVETAKRWFYRHLPEPGAPARRGGADVRRVRRRARRFSARRHEAEAGRRGPDR